MTTNFTLAIAGFSEKHSRPANQDRIFPTAETLPTVVSLPTCVAVADGMGGTEQGELAASLAVESIPSFLQTIASMHRSDIPMEQHIETFFRHANQRIIEQAGGIGIAGSTLSMLLFENLQFWPGHLGDSRIYLWRGQQLHLLTTDDNAFYAFLRKGYTPFYPQQCHLSQDDQEFLRQQQWLHRELFYIPISDSSTPLSIEELSQTLHGQVALLCHQKRITTTSASREKLLWALGKSDVLPESQIPTSLPTAVSPQLQEHDLFLLCTDGLHGVFSPLALQKRMQQIAARLQSDPLHLSLLSWGCDTLLQDACDAGSSDNISLLLISVGKSSATTAVSNSVSSLNNAASPSSSVVTSWKDDGTSSLPRPDISEKLGKSDVREKQDRSGHAPLSLAPNTRKNPEKVLTMAPPSSKRPLNHAPLLDFLSQNRHNIHFILLYSALALALILLLFSWVRGSQSIPSTDLRTNPVLPTEHQTRALFWMPISAKRQAPYVERRVQALQQLYQDFYFIETIWLFTPQERQHAQKAIQVEELQYTQWQRIVVQAPLEEHHFAAWDRAFQQAVHRVLHLMAPKVELYLDELHWKIPLPPHHPSLTIPLSVQRHFRQHILQRWQQIAAAMRWESWTIALMVERIIYENQSSSKTTLQARLQLLQQAQQWLQKQQPHHTMIPGLSNRIQLLQAHIQRGK